MEITAGGLYVTGPVSVLPGRLRGDTDTKVFEGVETEGHLGVIYMWCD